jgi:hypothetical protein
MDPLRTVAGIIAALGVSALARDLGHENVSTVSSWKLRGSIPPQHWKRIVEFAEVRDIRGVTYEALAEAHAADQAQATASHETRSRDAEDA